MLRLQIGFLQRFLNGLDDAIHPGSHAVLPFGFSAFLGDELKFLIVQGTQHLSSAQIVANPIGFRRRIAHAGSLYVTKVYPKRKRAEPRAGFPRLRFRLLVEGNGRRSFHFSNSQPKTLDYFAAAKRLLTSSQFTTFQNAAT